LLEKKKRDADTQKALMEIIPVDTDDVTPMQYLEKLDVDVKLGNEKKKKQKLELKGEGPFKLILHLTEIEQQINLKLRLHFMGNYNEPVLDIESTLDKKKTNCVFVSV